ncbi:uncharacterized protein [Nicotiana sylvestris]|uniref:uncharacterized protein n=1 Tax=Nicotiana sylvestris TaxID=4096 RepID=UPI00388C9033
MKGVMRFEKKGKLNARYIGYFKIFERVDFSPVQLDKDLTYIEEKVAILDRYVRKLRTKNIALVKVQWRGQPVEEVTWETEHNLQSHYPHLFGTSGYRHVSQPKKIWEALQTAHEVTTQVKQSKINMLTTKYELFRMKDDESVQDMHTRFTSIINELPSLGETIPRIKLTYEMKKKKDSERRDPKREKNLALKIKSNGQVDQYKNNSDKATKRNSVPDRCFNRKNATDNVVRQALAAWGDSSSESEFGEDDEPGNNSMMAVESDDEDDDDDEVKFLDVQRNLKSYSPKKLMSLANVLTDAYHSLINGKYVLIVELGEAEQSRDDLVVVVVDLRETIENLKKERDVLDIIIVYVEQERDDHMAVVADLKETIKSISMEKDALIEKVVSNKHERDDLLVVVIDLKKKIGELEMESRSECSKKGKEVVSETHIKLESELNLVKSSPCAEFERNKQLQEKLDRVKSDLEKSIKWTWSSDAITAMYTNNGGKRQRIGFQRETIPYNPQSKYVTIPDNWLCTHCGNNGHLKENCKARFQLQQKNKYFAVKGRVKGNSLQWYMDNGCSKHMTGNTYDFLSLNALQGGNVSFGNGKKGYILRVGRIDKSLSHSIENVYYVNIFKYNLLSVSQNCDKGNKNGDLSCLSAVDDDVELWNRRLGHASFTLLNKLVRKDLVHGLPKSSFKDHKVCDACVKGKKVRSSFKPKKEVSTARPFDLLYMDLC